jgi:hypothetical protein
MLAGAVVLTTVGFVAAKANKMFAGVTTGYAVLNGNNVTLTNLPSAHYTNVKGLLNTAIIATASSSHTKLSTIFTNTGHTNKVFYKP